MQAPELMKVSSVARMLLYLRAEMQGTPPMADAEPVNAPAQEGDHGAPKGEGPEP
jgi:hypothetical protein